MTSTDRRRWAISIAVGDNADDQTDNGANDPDDPSDVRSADDRCHDADDQ